MSRPDESGVALGRAWYAVGILFLAYTISFIDRTILALLVQPVQADLGISDFQISLLHGFAFAIFYTTLGIPIAQLADRMSRRNVIVAGIAVWSLMTALCGLAGRYWQLFLARVGVGVGEAALSPAAYSMIYDLFPRRLLGRALSIYSTGVYVGGGLAFIIGGAAVAAALELGSIRLLLIGEVRAWQLVFIVVGLPGLLVALLMFTVPEPARRHIPRTDGEGSFRSALALIGRERQAFFAHLIGFALLGLLFNGFLAWIPTLVIRKFSGEIGDVGLVIGLSLMVFGSAGIASGGAFSDALARRGHADSTLRTGIVAAVALIPVCLLLSLSPSLNVTYAAICLFFFFSAFPYGAAAAGIQLISPPPIRAQLSAVYLFVLNLLGIGVGPSAVAIATDFWFGDPAKVGQSLAIVAVLSAAPAILILWRGLAPFRASVERRQTEA